jgi:hypothetical protein
MERGVGLVTKIKGFALTFIFGKTIFKPPKLLTIFK